MIVLSLAAIPVGALISALRDPMLHRRSRFWLRFAVVVVCMFVPWTVGLVEAVGAQIGVPLLLLGLAWALLLLGLAPHLLFRRPGSDPGPSDDGGGGPGGGDRQPPDRPLGGIPLPDADQPRWRLRGPHGRRRSLRPRRPARERERRPTRVRADHVLVIGVRATIRCPRWRLASPDPLWRHHHARRAWMRSGTAVAATAALAMRALN